MKLSDPITAIKGIGKVRASLFKKVGVENVGDLLSYFPRTYSEYPEISKELSINKAVALCGKLLKPPVMKKTRVGSVTTAYLLIDKSKIDLVWFNLPHIASMLKDGGEFVYYGTLTQKGKDAYKMDQPIIYKKEKYLSLVGHPIPVYPLTKDLKNNVVKDATSFLFKNLDSEVFLDYLDEEYKSINNLINENEAYLNIHFPENYDILKLARKRLVFDEFFDFFIQVLSSKDDELLTENPYNFNKFDEYENACKALPFELTEGQRNTLNDLKNDFLGPHTSQRMIQADVGSGKTIIAFLSMLICAENGYSSAIMAPTEVLATQHYNTFCNLISSLNLKYDAVLLTGKMSAKDKKIAKEQIANSNPKFIIGTHAIIQNSVVIPNLALVIVDEQHRFGVKQRKALSDKGSAPFSVVMSATPIPRSLAMILYTDMNISIIKEVPKKRLPIKNCVIKEDKRKTAYKFIFDEVKKGNQAYIICPLVDTSEKTEAENVTEYYDKIRKIFPKDIRIAALHGKMSSEEKNSIMEDFSSHNTDILISTTVIEVGIDVPNSTVMMIENAGRFGLSQLHQLRGRIGRGDKQSYCIFMDDSKDEENERLSVINSSNDGFFIANEDLKLRGPGELYGLRQSGSFGFRIGDIYTDSDLLMLAYEKATKMKNDEAFKEVLTNRQLSVSQSSNNWNNI